MLDELERKLTAVVADAVAARTHLSVEQAAAAPAEPVAGKGILRVGLAELEPEGGFARDDLVIDRANGAERAKRVLPLGFRARIAFTQRPQSAAAENVRAAHDLLLEDLARVAFALAAEGVRGGQAFATAAGDPGFAVLGFALRDGGVDDAAAGDPSGRLEYTGRVAVWPPEVAAGGDAIVGVDAVTAPLPLRFVLASPVVPAGGSTSVRVLGAAGRRLMDTDPRAFAPLQLALTVLSDLPPAGRGAVTSGVAGARTGLRIVSATDAASGVTYAAPTDPGTVETEYVAVHLATPEGDAGAFLGSVAVGLR